MNAGTFKKGIERVLRNIGFERSKKTFNRDGGDVVTLIAFEKAWDQWHLIVGFAIKALDANVPDRVPGCHLYFRLDSLFQEHREMLLDAGLLENAHQPEAYERMLRSLDGDVGRVLKSLGTVDGLRTALPAGRLDRGLIRKEARAYLEDQ